MKKFPFESNSPFADRPQKKDVPIVLLEEKKFEAWLRQQASTVKNAIRDVYFSAKPGQCALVKDGEGQIQSVLAGIHRPMNLYDLSPVFSYLQQNLNSDFLKTCSFSIAQNAPDARIIETSCIGWGLAAYDFRAYKAAANPGPRLYLPPSPVRERGLAFVEAISMLRDLINMPANDMGPENLEEAAVLIAGRFGAKMQVVSDRDLLKKNFPLIYAVGDSSPRRPRLIELNWGKATDPKITIAGKGVCFDTGGLDLKPPQFMRLMKKDMGGAAHALALAWLVMSLRLPVRLKVLIPAVENSVSGTSYRPGDVLQSRKGLSVENTNTDAEGRLIMADVLTYACEDPPDLIVDFTTLTGSARAALGQDIPALFSNNEKLAGELKALSLAADDPLWPMPLWAPYKKHIESPVADLVNSTDTPGDLIYSALFLQSFLEGNSDWVHLDLFAWESAGRPGRPKGGADNGLRAVFALLEKRYGKNKPALKPGSKSRSRKR